ncbi:Ion channel [Lutibacter agarilyticus]|uniref:Ion channel n=1 Tax=Lutibacter agarilyticus TaxID=1109740 RepID=A0A238YMZ6_9FLAO|nr:ion channel [Lutibacter agarilyticus]SNR72410.1 Ion channel [Lutibacter agarilyticus]
MWNNIFIGCLLILITTFLHGLTTRYTMYLAIKYTESSKKRFKIAKEYLVSITVLIIFFTIIIESIVWALGYMVLGAIEKFEPAFYFSLVTFTTLGYGDITLGENYRLLASFEAANGIIIFGWSTAIVIAVVQKVYLQKYSKKD